MITVHTNYENIEAHKKITFGVNHSILLNTPTKLNIFFPSLFLPVISTSKLFQKFSFWFGFCFT